jgi:hypothetical protein
MTLLDWSAFFQKHPELNPPGYEEAVEAVKRAKEENAEDPIKLRLQEIHKEKQSAKNKARSKNRKKQ